MKTADQLAGSMRVELARMGSVHTVGLVGEDGGAGRGERGVEVEGRGEGGRGVRAGAVSGMSTGEKMGREENMIEIGTKPGRNMSRGVGVIQEIKMTEAKIPKDPPLHEPKMIFQKLNKNQM